MHYVVAYGHDAYVLQACERSVVGVGWQGWMSLQLRQIEPFFGMPVIETLQTN